MSKITCVAESCRMDGSWAGVGSFTDRKTAMACAREMRRMRDSLITSVEVWQDGEQVRHTQRYGFVVGRGWKRI